MLWLSLLQTTASVPPTWLSLTVLAAVVSGIVAIGVAVYNARNARTSLDEGRAYTERLGRVNPYIELIQVSMHQCMDISAILGTIRKQPFSKKLQLMLLENSGGALAWGQTGVQLSRLRFSIVLVLQSQESILSFLEKTSRLTQTQYTALSDIWAGRMESFEAGQQRYMELAVEIIDLVRVLIRGQKDRDQAESLSLDDKQIQRLLLKGTLSEPKFKLLPADYSWAAWWTFDDLTGPGEEETDISAFLPVFTACIAKLKRIPAHLEVREESILHTPKKKAKDGIEISYKEHFFVVHVRFPSQAALDGFVPVLASIKLQSRLIWASPFVPQEMRSHS